MQSPRTWRTNAVVATLALTLTACGDSKGGLVRYEVRDWSPGYGGEYANGDFIARGKRISADRVRIVETDLPGLGCAFLQPAPDGTEFVQCAKVHARVAGGQWQEVAAPVTGATFVGQDATGARYFSSPPVAPATASLLWVWPPSATAFLPPIELPAGTTPFVHASGTLFASTYLPYGFWEPIRPERRVGQFYRLTGTTFGPPVTASFIDFDDNLYEADGVAGWDRISPAGQRDELYFKTPSNNQVHVVAGVGSDGRLYGLTIAKDNVADTRPENSAEIDTLISMGPGDGSWREESEPLSTPESRAITEYEWQDAFVVPGRNHSWWLGKCLANCVPGGANSAHQSEILQWQGDGAPSSTFRNAYAVWRHQRVAVPMPGPAFSALSWQPKTDLASLGLADCGSSALEVCIEAGPTATLGTHRLSYQGPSGYGDKTLELEVKGGDTVPLAAPRKITIQERWVFGTFTGGLLWLDTAGVVHQRTSTVTDVPVAGLPVDIISIERQMALNVSGQDTPTERMTALTADGRVFVLSVNAEGLMEAGPALALPPIYSLHPGVGLGVDGNVYPLSDNAQPIPGLANIRHLFAVYSVAFIPSAVFQLDFRALDASGQSFTGYARGAFSVPPVVTPGERNTTWRRVGAAAGNLCGDGTVCHTSGVIFDESGPVIASEFVATDGNVVQSTLDNAGVRVVTAAGEIWTTRIVPEGFSRFDVAAPEAIVPAGRKAVALQGKYVWLDDGTIFEQGQLGSTTLDLTNVALPAP